VPPGRLVVGPGFHRLLFEALPGFRTVAVLSDGLAHNPIGRFLPQTGKVLYAVLQSDIDFNRRRHGGLPIISTIQAMT